MSNVLILGSSKEFLVYGLNMIVKLNISIIYVDEIKQAVRDSLEAKYDIEIRTYRFPNNKLRGTAWIVDGMSNIIDYYNSVSILRDELNSDGISKVYSIEAPILGFIKLGRCNFTSIYISRLHGLYYKNPTTWVGKISLYGFFDNISFNVIQYLSKFRSTSKALLLYDQDEESDTIGYVNLEVKEYLSDDEDNYIVVNLDNIKDVDAFIVWLNDMYYKFKPKFKLYLPVDLFLDISSRLSEMDNNFLTVCDILVLDDDSKYYEDLSTSIALICSDNYCNVADASLLKIPVVVFGEGTYYNMLIRSYYTMYHISNTHVITSIMYNHNWFVPSVCLYMAMNTIYGVSNNAKVKPWLYVQKIIQ